MARPFEKPLRMEGKITYCRLGDKLLVFPSDCVQKDEEELIKAITTSYDKNISMYITKEQHDRLVRLLAHHIITMWH